MKRELPGGFELDDDPARVDHAEVHRFLSTEAHWALGRPFETQERLVRESRRVVGLYYEGQQIGFTRAASDGIVYAYLADVYVLPEFRGRGLGTELVRFTVGEGPLTDLRWLLHTPDMHGLYEKAGFGKPSEKVMERFRPEARPAETRTVSDQRQELEDSVVQLVEAVIAECQSKLADRGLTARPPEVVRWENDGGYSSEVRIYIEKDGQIEDALEFFVFFNGVRDAETDEMEKWLRAELSTL
jgi:GNAT superfamily N-acetyltransferase